MSRIILPANTLVGRKLLNINVQIIDAANAVSRLKAIADQITNNGVSPALLESSPESSVPAGQGNAIYSGIGQIKTALDGLAALVSAIDQG